MRKSIETSLFGKSYNKLQKHEVISAIKNCIIIRFSSLEEMKAILTLSLLCAPKTTVQCTAYSCGGQVNVRKDKRTLLDMYSVNIETCRKFAL